MKFDIDVSGEDIFSQGYVVCIANKDGIIKGFKFTSDIARKIGQRHSEGIYNRYQYSKKGKATLKVRVYCVIIYLLFKSLGLKGSLELSICRDFDGKQEEIKSNLNYLLKDKLRINLQLIEFVKLSHDSNAHKYAYLMKKDNRNKLKTYVNINLEEIEQFLKK